MELTDKQITEIAQMLDTGMNAYINTDTGEMDFIVDFESTYGDTELWEERLAEIEEQWESYIIIEQMDSSDSFRIMERFADQVSNDKIREQLFKALNGRKPFARFKDEINYYDEIRQDWFDFKQQEMEKYVKRVLEIEEQIEFVGNIASSDGAETQNSTGESNTSEKEFDLDVSPIVKLAQVDLNTRYGTWQEYLFYDGQKEVIALVMGEVKNKEEVLCRMHSSCIHGHYFNSLECNCQAEMNQSQAMIQKAGAGIILLLDQEGKGNGHFALLNSIAYKRQGMKQADAYAAAGFKQDARSFMTAAHVVRALDLKSLVLITGSTNKVNALREYGIEVVKNIELKE